MGHADFRVGGKIFATMGYPNSDFGMVKLSPADQAYFVDPERESFMPAKGAWGKQGATIVKLKAVKKRDLQEAMKRAWQGTASKARIPGR